MKRLFFAAFSLDVGGIETALVTLINNLANQKENNSYKYKITLQLERKQGIFLSKIDPKIDIIEYTPNNNKIIVIRKLVNLFKQIVFKAKYTNKFDFSCAYATYSIPASFTARVASTNSALWCHMDYLAFFNNDKKKAKAFFIEKHYEEFKHIVFVSEESKETFLKIFPTEKNKTVCINNLIDYADIIKLGKENVEENFIKKENNIITFINVGRHDENQKKLSRIIEAAKLLNKDSNVKNNFRIIFVGNGESTSAYKALVNKYKLNNKITFVGRKKNPYPYINLADCTILTSDYEGFPVVFVESMVLNKPIITTKVSGTNAIMEQGYGIIVNNDVNSIYKTMKNFVLNSYEINNKFNPEKYNENIIKQIQELILM